MESTQVKTKETIKVKAIGPYGVLVDDGSEKGVWYGAEEPSSFLRGGQYSVLVSTSGRGKKSVLEVLDQNMGQKPAADTNTKSECIPVPLVTNHNKPRDFEKEAEGKSRCKVVAASMPTLLSGIDLSDISNFKSFANDMVKYIMTGK